MCGILGVKVQNKDEGTINFIKSLMLELRIRGTHSLGVAYSLANSIELERIFGAGGIGINWFVEGFKTSEADTLIFHSRYSTSGNHEVMENNQPIIVGRTAIAMNGILTQATKQVYEKQYSVQCNSANDAEIFLRKLIMDGVDIPEFVKANPLCSFAGVYLVGGHLYAFRNNKRPLYYGEYKNCKYFTSTIDVIARAGGDLNNVEIVPPFEEKLCE